MSLLSSYLKLRGGGSATVGGGGGNASVGVLLRQTGENDKGLFLTARGADLTWHGRGESVGDADPAIGGHVDLPNNGGGPASTDMLFSGCNSRRTSPTTRGRLQTTLWFA